MLPIWLMIAQGVKKVADNQNNHIDTFNKNQQYNPNVQPMNNVNSGGGLGNAFSTFSSIYGNYLNDEKRRSYSNSNMR
ncbi:hypothetical protein [Sinorhizobium sp. GL28]|uniref:hypothetical protein n=1 Tax=Sinorhizobium sp. GL28 TaxID=1358418 RepID=UPI000ABE08AB|nr:hypothetical protein [Sinorhizobium sp. GL28]